MTSATGKAKGGKARAEKLTPERRKEIARKGGKARWDTYNDSLPLATHLGELPVGDLVLPCYVIEDEHGNPTRVISSRGINTAFTGKHGGGAVGG